MSPLTSWIESRTAARLFDCAAVLVALSTFTLFVWFNVEVIAAAGIASADDGYFAIIARALAQGRGYGLPASSETMRMFEPSIGSGPGLVLPLAIATLIFGAHSWTPGVTVLVLFTAQLVVLAAMLRRDGMSPRNVAVFLALTLMLLVLVSRYAWSFAFGLGEPVALGWLLIGTAALFGGWPAVAGVAFSLALLTKSITLLAIGPVGLVWIAATRDLRGAVRVAFAAAVLPLAFEVYRLSVLGPHGYADNLRETIAFIRSQGSDVAEGARLDRFADTARRLFMVPWAAGLILVAAAALIRKRAAALFAAFAAAGLVSLSYILFLGRIEVPRYWFTGLACLCVAAAIPALGTAWRGVAIACLVTALVPDLRTLPQWADLLVKELRAEGLAEQHTAIATRAGALGLPVVVPSNTTFEVIYLLPAGHAWRQTYELEALAGQPFLFVARKHFSGDHDRVFAARAQCEPEGNWLAYEVRRCAARFWSSQSASSCHR